MSWGHNNLIRTRPLQEVGGFDESFVGEDLAMAIAMLERGYGCKMVDVYSYDAEVRTVQGYLKRSLRYAQQTLQIARTGLWRIGLTSNLMVFMAAYFFLVWCVYIPGKIVAVWGYTDRKSVV
jgi:cellulose synthase/poly-beta-1,6-N-acetylglucosamine synthase-like glycosyltransferase